MLHLGCLYGLYSGPGMYIYIYIFKVQVQYKILHPQDWFLEVLLVGLKGL